MKRLLRTLLQLSMTEENYVACRRSWYRFKYAGSSRYCPVCCNHLRIFLEHGVIKRPNAVCPVCLSRDRHRLAMIYLQQETTVFTEALTFLHLAPELEMAQRLRALPNLRYISGDLVHRAMMHMDICRIPLRTSCVDFVYCSHVLNTLKEDGPAMLELFRILNPNGCAFIQIPSLDVSTTLEAGVQSTQEKRAELFNDSAIYRYYGRDLKDRLVNAGFLVEVVPYYHRFSESDRIRLGLIDEDLYVCRRPA